MRFRHIILTLGIIFAGCDDPVPNPPSFPVQFTKLPENRFIATGEKVLVTVAATSSNNLPIKYAWKQISGPVINFGEDLGGTQFFITPPKNNGLDCLDIDQYQFQVTASDSTYAAEEKFTISATNRWCQIQKSDGKLLSDRIVKLARSENTLWIATDNGLNSFDGDSSWKQYTKSTSKLASNNLSAIGIASDKMVWVGGDAGIQWFAPDNPGVWNINASGLNPWGEGLFGNQIKALAFGKNHVYVSNEGARKGISIFDLTIQSWNSIWNPYSGWENQAMATDANDLIWIGVNGVGVWMYGPGKTDNYLTLSSSGWPKVIWKHFNENKMLIGLKESLLLAVPQGFKVCDASKIWDDYGSKFGGKPSIDDKAYCLSYSSKDGLSGNDVRAFASDADKRIWIATDKGISVATMNQGQTPSFVVIDKEKSGGLLPSNDIVDLVSDASGSFIWIATNGSGLVRALAKEN